MRTIILTIIFLWAQVVCAQLKNTRKRTHQLEYGVNYLSILNNNLNGLGSFYDNGFNFNQNYYFGYKSIIKEKHCINLSFKFYNSKAIYKETPNLG
jgi:uncharacterized membrane protein